MRAVLALLCFLPLPAGAAEGVSITHDACRWLVQHIPSADVAYQEGVDVTGKAVAPADLAANNVDVPDTFTIPLTIDLASRLGYAPSGAEAKAALGTITLGPTGLSFNGKPVPAEVNADLATFCRS